MVTPSRPGCREQMPLRDSQAEQVRVDVDGEADLPRLAKGISNIIEKQ